jgi:fumarylacetoacetate (FAA) hydrolase
MKFATLKAGGRDGTLVVVSRDLARYQTVGGVAPTLQKALDEWDAVRPELEAVYDASNHAHATVPCRALTSGRTARPT